MKNFFIIFSFFSFVLVTEAKGSISAWPPIANMPLIKQERIVCSILASIKYEIPANIVLAIAEKEGGKPGQWIRNSNGSYDVGPMQFNTAYLRDLKKYGITADDVADSGCYPFKLASWRLRKHIINDTGDIWTRAANYHSYTPKYNAIYRADLIKKANKWANWLNDNFSNINMVVLENYSFNQGLQARKTIKKTKRQVSSTIQQTSYVPRTIRSINYE